MIDLSKLAAELHADAVERGFWDVDDALDKHFAKMHSELSEAMQEERCGRPMLYVDDIEVPSGRITDVNAFDGRKPEGIAAELADFVMMALDLWAQIDLDLNGIFLEEREILRSDSYAQFRNMEVYKLALICHSMLEKIRKLEGTAATTLSAMAICTFGVELWLEQRGVNLWDVIRIKADYNKNRPKLHGRKY